MLTDEEREWALRMRRFLDVRDYSAISQADLDRLHEHWSFFLRLNDLPELIDGTGGDDWVFDPGTPPRPVDLDSLLQQFDGSTAPSG